MANMFHDLIYDDQPDKELRSMVAFSGIYEAMAPNFDDNIYNSARALIMDTITHDNVRDDDRMILLDLADLGDSTQAQVNHGLILDDTIALYGTDIVDCARGENSFMNNLRSIAKKNKISSTYPDYWDKIISGIQQTIHLNEGILARA